MVGRSKTFKFDACFEINFLYLVALYNPVIVYINENNPCNINDLQFGDRAHYQNWSLKHYFWVCADPGVKYYGMEEYALHLLDDGLLVAQHLATTI